jgi:hypothetical protein
VKIACDPSQPAQDAPAHFRIKSRAKRDQLVLRERPVANFIRRTMEIGPWASPANGGGRCAESQKLFSICNPHRENAIAPE